MREVNIDRTVTGVVTSTGMDKTVTVKVERKVPHPLYKKYIRRTTKLHAHDEDNKSKVGDLVTIKQCRSLSKTRSEVLVSIDKSSVA